MKRAELIITPILENKNAKNELIYSYLLSGINITPASQVFLEIYHKSFFIPQPFRIKGFNKLYALLTIGYPF